MMTAGATPAVSVILCTYNPQLPLLEWTLDSLERQTLPTSEFEVVIVDSDSNPPLEEAGLRNGRRLPLRLVRSARPGLAMARCAGIDESRASLLVFVDDDNHLETDYLEQAIRIARQEPAIGLFGGISKAVLEAPIASWQEPLLPYLAVRDYGAKPITSTEDRWGKWEPIGAGMVSRRDVAELFAEIVCASNEARLLGRRRRTLLSGDDTLFARAANRLGYACSYQPALRLSHFIKKERLRFPMLVNTVRGHGRSFAILQRVLGVQISPCSLAEAVRALAKQYPQHVRTMGWRAGTVAWFWGYGYLLELRNGLSSRRPIG